MLTITAVVSARCYGSKEKMLRYIPMRSGNHQPGRGYTMTSGLIRLAGFLVMLKSKKNMKLAIPFGPFLSLGAIIYVFFGKELIIWYWNVLG